MGSFDAEGAGLSRRGFLKGAAATGIGLSLVGGLGSLAACSSGGGGGKTIHVLAPAAPDPAPVGVAKFSDAAVQQFADWKKQNGISVAYDAIPWTQLHDKMATTFASGQSSYDVIYMSGWVPEFASNLSPFGNDFPADLKSDMPPSCFKTTTWGGQTYGAVFTLSVMTLFYNKEMLSNKGISQPPTTWDELKGMVQELTGGGNYGWVLNYGDPAGIGGVASYWMAFLQQAGGKMYDDSGMPAFNTPEGVDALQMMLDLNTAGTDPGSISYVGINDATNVFMAGRAAMMMNWPYMWVPAQDPKTSKVSGKIDCALLPAGPAGTASIDGTDAWTVTKKASNRDNAMKLIEFYLDKDQQKSQAIDTGWLPIRLSVLNDPDVQSSLPNAKVVMDQATHPYDSYVTPDYNEVTQAMGVEIQKALKGQQTAAQTIKNSADQVTSIVKKRTS
ncbi:MAG: substrate-binding domain-containing protein [Actinomycetia bacterium]|nr:substrate-binding domain-containing protein [Actinomycetes bacterium]